MQVQLDQFEGPLALLLYLIRKEEMDIYDIPMTKITRQYLDYISQMKELDLEGAGEFVAMAATLIQIKSQLLLPNYNEHGEEVPHTEDPRKPLVQRLLEYQKYQEAAHKLNDRPLLGRDVWVRGMREDIKSDEDGITLDDRGLFALIAAYRTALRNMKKATHVVKGKIQSIASRVLEIKDRLIPGQRILLSDLIEVGENARVKMLVTFLSILEITKIGFTTVFQSENYGPIHVDTLKAIDGDVLARVGDYDAQDANALAEKLATEETTPVDMNSDFEVLTDSGAGEQLVLGQNGEATSGVVDGLQLDAATDEDILAAEKEMALDLTPSELGEVTAVSALVDTEFAEFALNEAEIADEKPVEVVSEVADEATGEMAPELELKLELKEELSEEV